MHTLTSCWAATARFVLVIRPRSSAIRTGKFLWDEWCNMSDVLRDTIERSTFGAEAYQWLGCASARALTTRLATDHVQ